MSGKPRLRQWQVVILEPSRAVATIIYAILALAAVAVAASAMLYPTDAWPQQWRLRTSISPHASMLAAVAASCVALLLLSAVMVNGRRWHLAVAVKRLLNSRAVAEYLPDRARVPPTRSPAQVIAPLEIRKQIPRRLPRPGRLRRVTRGRNVVGARPMSIAYLRLFDNQPRTRTFIQGAWREFGYVYLLRSAASVTPSEFRRARRLDGLFVTSREQFITRLDETDAQPSARHWRAFADIGHMTIRTWDPYGSYPLRAVLCHGAVWKAAVDVLLDRVDLVVLDLSGLRPRNLGTQYELQRVVDRFPVERVVFLADSRSDLRFLGDLIRAAWQNMAEGSPNSGPHPGRVVRIAVTDYYRPLQQGQQQGRQGQQTNPQIRLLARRRQTRRLAAALQLQAGPPGDGAASGPLPARGRLMPGQPGAVGGDRVSERRRRLLAGAGVGLALVLGITAVAAAVLMSPAPSHGTGSQACSAGTSNCRLGDRDLSLHSAGPDVTELQQRLHDLGFYQAAADGDFGQVTQAAVKAFQACARLVPDGVADVSGQGTIAAIRQASPASVARCL